jgi:hypothetical protein
MLRTFVFPVFVGFLGLIAAPPGSPTPSYSCSRILFEPKLATNKVRDDAVHLVVGFEHEPREKNRTWRFTRWDLIDLAGFNVKLKAEFQGSNRDL